MMRSGGTFLPTSTSSALPLIRLFSLGRCILRTGISHVQRRHWSSSLTANISARDTVWEFSLNNIRLETRYV